MSIFQQAARLKLRFESPLGLLNAEDLWDLPLSSATGKANLDDIARSLHRKLQSAEDVSFVSTEAKGDTLTQLKFDIVKHIIDVRLEENKTAADAQANKAKKQKLLEVLERKENAALEGMDADEIRKMIEGL